MITGNIGAPAPGLSDLISPAQLNATAAEDPWTGEPSIVSKLTTAAFRVLRAFTDFTDRLGVDTATPIAQLLTSESPPWFTTLGLNVQRGEFEGMPVWTLQSPQSSSENVVGLHGGGYVLQPNIFNWLDYAAMARDTGATVVVPIYPLAPQGTAATIVPQTADFLSALVEQHGSENVTAAEALAANHRPLSATRSSTCWRRCRSR